MFSWPSGNGAPTDPWITLNSNGDVVEWALTIQNDFSFPPYANFLLQTLNTTDPRYQRLSTADGDITGGIYDAVLFRQAPLFELHILESNVASPGTWAVAEPTCVVKLTAECGITFNNANKTFAIAVKRDYVCLTLDGSGSIDPAGDPLQITWVIDETNIVADAVVTNCLDLGCHTITMMASDGQTRCHQFLDVCVITPTEAVQQCIDLVEQTQLAHKNKRPLIATLKAAQAAFDHDGWKVGALMLKVFQNKVRTQTAGRNPTEAAMFIECAENVLQAIDCVVNDATSSAAGSRPSR